MTSTATGLTEQQLTEYEALIQRATPLGAATASPGMAAALLAEIRRLRAELASARSGAIASAADVVDAKLTAEPDHNRASALYELLLQLRGELPCTCARTGGLHEKGCSKYVPGHELISRHNALARYRAERTNQPAV